QGGTLDAAGVCNPMVQGWLCIGLPCSPASLAAAGTTGGAGPHCRSFPEYVLTWSAGLAAGPPFCGAAPASKVNATSENMSLLIIISSGREFYYAQPPFAPECLQFGLCAGSNTAQ